MICLIHLSDSSVCLYVCMSVFLYVCLNTYKITRLDAKKKKEKSPTRPSKVVKERGNGMQIDR